MLQRMKVPMNSLMITALAVVGLCVTEANAQKFREDFDEVTGSGGGPFYFGQGFGDTEGFGWDDGLVGEDAFGTPPETSAPSSRLRACPRGVSMAPAPVSCPLATSTATCSRPTSARSRPTVR
jgi:hypothetical protein